MSRRRRIAAVVALGVLAPWAAECSWGGFALRDYPLVVVFLGPLYGGAAILVREAVRRAGLGWPSIALLGAAFGVYMAGLVDQSLFNPSYLDDTEYAGLIRDPALTRLPGLGLSVGDAFNYVGNHIVLSIGLPIAVVESIVGAEGRREPWLGRWGLGGVGVLFVLGSLLIHSDAAKGFTAAPHQLGAAVAIVVVLVVLALVPGRLAWSWPQPKAWERGEERRAPWAMWSAVVALAAAASVDLVPGWAGVAINAGAILVAVVVIVRWSRLPGWSQRHVLAAFSGPLVLSAVVAYVVPNYDPASPAEAILGDVTITVVTVALLTTAFLRLRRESRPEVDQYVPK
ncbi:hypothetical protein [Cryptosporangium arvum]|uniref:hypothetical protein n=1 Tax=Cryptosporangium arvum TaxID=80871 RepID=UPI000685A74D|nr:hypothetical protein [Cryptosporangium arvum]